ncbi:MAG: lipid-A-disaccharide synthase, partial [Burkholderiaceae bacterium]
MGSVRVGLVTAEASGDWLAADLLRQAAARAIPWQVQGIGGEVLESLGMQTWWSSQSLNVRGYVEVLRHYRRIVSMRRALLQRFLREPPQVFVGVDAPDFNLPLAAQLRQAGVPTVQYVCPSVWAWRAQRLHAMREALDHVLCLFPFEVPMLERAGIAATFVGHPLAQHLPLQPARTAARQHLGVDAAKCACVALLPGSRVSEVQHLLPAMLA